MGIIQKCRHYVSGHRKSILITVVIFAMIGLVLGIVNYMVIGSYEKYILRDPDQISRTFSPDRPIGIVLGGGIQDGKPRPLLKDRLDTAANLLKNGSVRKLIVSGDNRYQGYNEPDVMRDYLVTQKSVNPELVQVDYAGRSTYETCERAKKIFGMEKTVLISESTHLPRAIYLCRSFGIETYGYSSHGQASAGLQVGQRFREVLARTKAAMNVYIMGEKTVLGPKIAV